MKLPILPFVAALIASGAASAATVDLDSIANASMDASNAVTLTLGAGTYTVTPVIGAYTAFTRFGTVDGCNAGGEGCHTGWEHSYLIKIGGVSTGYGDGDAEGGFGPLASGAGYYDSAARAFATGARAATFTLAAETQVAFWIKDDGTYNNLGGVSLDVSPVPEPGEWAMMAAGLLITGGFARRSKRKG